MRKLLFAFLILPLFSTAQYKISGFVTQTDFITARKYIPKGHKLSLIIKDSFNVKAIKDLYQFDKKYTETKEDRRTHRYFKRLKKEFKKDKNVIADQKKYEADVYGAYLHAISHPVQEKLIDQNGNYEFDNIPNGDYVLILDLDGSGLPLEPEWKYEFITVKNNDLNFNFEGGSF